MSKLTPDQMLKHVQQYAKNLEDAKRSHVVVGLPKDKVGGKVYGDGMSILRIAAIHEFGATFMHPGGTPYLPGGAGIGKAIFISKDRQLGQYPETKPHSITIPRRSFLRAPFVIKKKAVDEAIADEFRNVAEKGMKAKIALGRVGAAMTNLAKGAFTTLGYGSWPRSKKQGTTLVDTGTLRNSITWVVRDAAA